MKTRERILECALRLFNERGEPNVTPLELATEMGISPGNLYYHFHGKEPLIQGLFLRFNEALEPLLDPPADVLLGTDDFWLFLHLIVERMAHYRFLFQDLSNLASRFPKLARGIRSLLQGLKRTLAALLSDLDEQGALISRREAQQALVEQIILTLLFSLDYQRIVGREGEVSRVVYQAMMLMAPHFEPNTRTEVEALAASYAA